MRDIINKNLGHSDLINYRGSRPSRLDNLTDAVFGIAITLLIFNLKNPNSFIDLLSFTKTLPAFLISIAFLVLIWYEHVRFSEVYSMKDTTLTIINTLFIALIIFYVYPLRFLTVFLTNFFFQTEVEMNIHNDQVPLLMIYYGLIAAALYFLVFLFYLRASKLKLHLQLNEYEAFYTDAHKIRLLIMFVVPLFSVLLTYLLMGVSLIWASVAGGLTYMTYSPAMFIWINWFNRKSRNYRKPTEE